MKPKTGIKVLRNGSSFHGGYFKWSLPTQDKDGKWTPGEWTPPVKPVVCISGYHLTTMPTEWWDSDNECVAYLVEYKGRVDGLPVPKDSKGKFAVEKCRLLRPLTPGELARHRIYTKGTHSIIVSRGKTAIVSGDAVLYCHGSGRVLAYDRSQIFAHENVSVASWDNCQVFADDRVRILARGNSKVDASADVVLTLKDDSSAEVTDHVRVSAMDQSVVLASGSVQVTALGSSVIHAGGQVHVEVRDSSRVVLSGDSVGVVDVPCPHVRVARSSDAIIIDRRGDKVRTYSRGSGLDGWSFVGGKWVKARKK